MIHSKNISIDLSRYYANGTIRLHEGDINGTSLVISVYDNTQPFSLSGCSAKYDAVIGEEVAERDANATVSDNTITVPITANMTADGGLLRIDVKLLKNSDVLYLPTIEAHTQHSALD